MNEDNDFLLAEFPEQDDEQISLLVNKNKDKLIETKEDKIERERRNLEEYVGINVVFNDPVHLFLNKYDLVENVPQVYFYVYSAGKKKIILWGIYNRENGQFYIQNGCKYATKNLIKYVKTWEKQYIFSFDTVKNRINKRLEQFLANKDKHPLLKSHKDYNILLNYLSNKKGSKFYKTRVPNYPRTPQEESLYFSRIRQFFPKQYDILISLQNELDLLSYDFNNYANNNNNNNNFNNSNFNIDLNREIQLDQEIEEINNDIINKLDDIITNYENNLIQLYDDYKQLKIYLSTQPESIYYKPEKKRELEKIIDPMYLYKVRKFLKPQYDKITEYYIYDTNLELDAQDFQKQIFKDIENQLKSYERGLNIKENLEKILPNYKEMLEINTRFYDFISNGRYLSNSYYYGLDDCPIDEDQCYTPYLRPIDLCQVFHHTPPRLLQNPTNYFL